MKRERDTRDRIVRIGAACPLRSGIASATSGPFA
jgi:hypothetical protein